MMRHNTTGKTAKARRLKAEKPERRAAPAASSRRQSPDADLRDQLEQNTRELAEARKLLAESLEQQTATSEVLKVISSSPGNLTPVFQAMLENATRICDAKFGNLLLYDGTTFKVAALHGAPPEWAELRRREPMASRHPNSPLSRLFRTRQPQHVADTTKEDAYRDGEKAFVDIVKVAGARTMVAVPMLKEEAVIGAMVIYRQEVRPFTNKQIELVQNFAAQAVIAIENTRLLNELRQRTDDLSQALEQQTATSEVLKVISSSPGDLEPVFQAMLENAVRICEAGFGVLFRYDGDAFHAITGINRPAALEEFHSRGPIHVVPGTPLDRILRTKAVAHSIDDTAEPNPGAAARLGGARSTVAVPMLKDNEVVGAFIIYRQEVRPFTDKQIELVTNFAAQAVIAIENTRLLNELRESLQQQTATADVLKVISSSPGELQPVFDAMLQNATRICDAKFGALFRTEREDALRAVAYHRAPEAFVEERRRNPVIHPAPDTTLGRAMRIKRPVQIGNVQDEPKYSDGPPGRSGMKMAELTGAKTLLAVPMVKEDELVGAVVIYRQEVRPFTDKQIELVQNFASQAVIAIENTRLLNELRESLAQQTATADVLKVISSSPGDLEPVFQAMLENATRICQANFGVLFQYEEGAFRAVALHGAAPPSFVETRRRNPVMQPIPGTALGRLVAAKQTVQIADARSEPAYSTSASHAAGIQTGEIRTVLSVPMLKEDELVGAFNLCRHEVRPFTDKQIELVQNFAAQAVIAIENARLLNELRQRTDDLSESLEQQTATSEVLGAIAGSSGDLAPVFQSMMDNATRICRAEFGVLYSYDGDAYRVAASAGLPPALSAKLQGPLRPGEGTAIGRVARTLQVAHIVDLPAEQVHEEDRQVRTVAAEFGIRTLLAVPMIKDGKLIGAISFFRKEVRPFSDKQIELVTNFAAQAVIAIENTRLLNELRQRTDDLSEALEQQTATSEVLKVISSSPGELEPVFEAMLANATRICGAQFGNLLLRKDDGFLMVAQHNAPLRYAEERRRNPIITPGPGHDLRRLIETKQAIHITDMSTDPVEQNTLVATLAGARTLLNVPMLKDEEVVGAIGVYRQEVRPFTSKQIELVQNFAAQAVIAIENTRLLNELRQRTDDLSKSLEDLQTAQDRLVQTQKLASLGQLTAGIAHEIKNPLNFVNNFSSLSTELLGELQENLQGLPIDGKARAEIDELTATLRGNLDKIEQHGKRADSIVKNMLLHSREGSGEHRPVDINAVVEESLNLAYHGARAEKQGFNITLERSFDPDAGEVDVFPQEITRVLLNLISNGCYAATKRKAEAGGGYEPTLAATTKNLGDRVEIRIRDNGTGIPPEVKDKMFNPFFTTKPAGEGTGLGLSLSHDIVVKQHAGAIEVDTEPGEYTEFRIILPRTAATLAKSGGRA